MRKKPILMYGTTHCDDCIRAKKFLTDHTIEYTFINIDEDQEAVKRVEKLNNGMHVVPTLIFPNGTVLSEPSNQELSAILGLH